MRTDCPNSRTTAASPGVPGSTTSRASSSESISESLSEATVRQALGAEPNALLGAGAAADAESLVRAMYGSEGQE